MNPQETTAVLGVMVAAWPTTEITAETTAVWVNELEKTHPDDALQAARSLIRSQKWFPAISEFLEAVKAPARARIEAENEARSLPSGGRSEADKEHVRKCLAEARAAVAANAGKARRVEGFTTVGESLGQMLDSPELTEEPF